MITRPLQNLLRNTVPKYFFSGGDIRHKFADEVTDQDYESQRDVHIKPITTERYLSFTSIMTSIPIFKTSTFLDFLRTNFDSIKAESHSDYIIPPRIAENSIFVFQSRLQSWVNRQTRASELVCIPLVMLTFTYPLFSLFMAAPVYYFFSNAQFYEMSRRTVVRMDILPHLEMISVQKVGAFGIIYSKLHRIQDLEHVTYESVYEEENYLWAIGCHGIDNNLIFKDRTNGEYFYFDKTGFWDKKGLEHPLLF